MADCINPVSIIKQGQVASCDGFLFSDGAEKDAATARDDAAYYHKLSDKLGERSKLQDDENVVLEQRLKLYMDATSNLSKEVAQRNNNEFLYNTGYFILGVIATTLIVRNIHQ